MSETATTSINCGSCAHLWKRTRPGFGVCGCAARRNATGEINPPVDLSSTCEFARLSAKLDPDFMPRTYQKRHQDITDSSILPPAEKPLEDYPEPKAAAQ